MLRLGANIYYMYKLANFDGHSMQYLGGRDVGRDRGRVPQDDGPPAGRTEGLMARIVGGVGTSHVPAIGAAVDHGKTGEPYWQPLFAGYDKAREWMAEDRSRTSRSSCTTITRPRSRSR